MSVSGIDGVRIAVAAPDLRALGRVLQGDDRHLSRRSGQAARLGIDPKTSAVPAAAGYNFGLLLRWLVLLRWLAELLRIIIPAFIETDPAQNIA